jgi:ankyrin repeat protein
MIFQAYPKATEVQNNEGWLPLLYALCVNVSSDIINELFNANPQAAAVQNNDGCLPLHYALANNASSEVINMLFHAHPKAAEVQNNDGCLPLHYACIPKIHLFDNIFAVLNLLISAYPDGIGAKDCYGKLPSDYLKNAASESSHVEHLSLLHKAVKAGASLHLIKLLLQAFPESCTTKDNDGMVPLHHACAIRATIHLETVMMLLDADEDSRNIKDKHGRTPMQVLQFSASHQDESKMFPLHQLAASSESLTEKSLLLLFNSYPESIRTPDKYGMLPFHHACLNEALSLELLMLLFNLFTAAVTEVGVNYKYENDEK